MLVYSVLLCSLVTYCASQGAKSWRDATILNEARYLGTNGQFGSSVKQNDGLEYKEEADESGNRKGSYSYIDPTGERRTVTFTAGKDGFKASGAHLPSSAAVSGAASPAAAAPVAAVPSYSGSSYSSGLESTYSSNLGGSSYSSGLARSSNGPALDSGFYNPDFDYPDDSSKGYDNGQYVPETQQSYSGPRAQQSSLSSLYKSAQPSQPSYSSSQYQSPSADYSQYSGRSNYNQYSTQAPVQQYPSYNQYSSEAPAYQSYNQINTDAPSYRSQSYPGKLSLNRSPDGFSYTFNTS